MRGSKGSDKKSAAQYLKRVEHMGYKEGQSGNSQWLHSSSDHHRLELWLKAPTLSTPKHCLIWLHLL
ncbi:hypothetical protein PTKIN_Ptkin08bG0012900 [Pterospermum kingtungense]